MSENENIVKELLCMTMSVIDKHKGSSSEAGEDYSIFDVANIETDERAICRVLHDLLSPGGKHGQCGMYLEIFLQDCLGKHFSKIDVEHAKVIREYYADGRPIDIVIRIGSTTIIPIEVKIRADDQEQQCYDYCRYAQITDENAKVVYLTLIGDPPAEKSRKNRDNDRLLDNEIKCLSFKKDIISWIEKCIFRTDKNIPVYGILNQLLVTIKRITNKVEDMQMNEVVEMINEESRRVKAAVIIADSIYHLRVKLLAKIAEKLQKDYNMEIIESENRDTIYYFATNDQITLFQINYAANTSNAVWVGVLSNIKVSPILNTDGYRVSGKTIRKHNDFFKLFDDGYMQDCVTDIVNYFKSTGKMRVTNI